jgi:hypothetical protein
LATLTAPNLVVLRNGLAVPIDAVNLLLNLERRGLNIRVDPADDAVLVGPQRHLTEQDKANIRQHRDALRDLVSYCERVQ